MSYGSSTMMLGEHKIRELNDEINVLMKRKHYWEIRIRELGGGDLLQTRTRQVLDIEGWEIPGVPGYRYYGAAKDLPGVRELFAERKDEPVLRKRNRVDLYKNITPDYYGFRDDDDGLLVPKEAQREKELLASAEAELADRWKKADQDRQRSGGVFGGNGPVTVDEDDSEDETTALASEEGQEGASIQTKLVE